MSLPTAVEGEVALLLEGEVAAIFRGFSLSGETGRLLTGVVLTGGSGGGRGGGDVGFAVGGGGGATEGFTINLKCEKIKYRC